MLSRLKEYIDYKGISIAGFERSIGMSNASFGKSLKNKGSIGADKLEYILKCYPDLNLYWLVTGRGDMLVEAGVKDRPGSSMGEKPPPKYGSGDKDKVIIAQNETIETQRKYIHRLEDEVDYLKKLVEELKPAESGQKRKAG